MKMTISVGRCLKRNTMLVWVKEYMIENFATCKNLCNLQELYTAFKEKHPNVNIGFSKFCALRLKWCVLDGSKMTHSVYVYGAHQNVALLVDAMDWNVTHKDMIKLTFSCLEFLHKIFLRSLLYHHHSQKYFFKWNITSSPYPEMLLISIIKLLFFFFSVIALLDVASCNSWRL